MRGIYIVLAIVLICWLIGQIRIGAKVEYCQQGFFLWLRMGVVSIPILPGKKGAAKKKEKKDKPQKNKKPEKVKKRGRGGQLQVLQQLIPVILDTVKKLRRKLQVDKLYMELTVAEEDPADAAVHYGVANATLGALWHPLTQAFHVKDGQAHVAVDFETTSPELYLLASLSLTIGQALTLALLFAIRALSVLMRTMIKKQRKAVINDGTKTSN